MTDKIEETPVPRAVANQLCYPFNRSEIALKATLCSIYPNDCDIDVRRWLSDFQPTKLGVVDQSENRIDCPVAAAVYTHTTRLVLAIVVFYDNLAEEEMQSAREFCRAYGVRFFPVETLDSYSTDILDRSDLCEEAGLGPACVSHIIPAARCPRCGGPLLHKTRQPTRQRHGLFYACAQYHGGVVGCPGFLCGAEEIFEHLHPGYRDLTYRIQNDVESALGESNWA